MRFLSSIRRASYKAGDFVREVRKITQQDLDEFSAITGDHNPIHKNTLGNPKPIIHGAFLNSIVAGIIGTKLPGPGSVVVSQNFSFPAKCFVDEQIECSVELLEIRKIIKIKYECVQNGNIVFQGDAKLIMAK